MHRLYKSLPQVKQKVCILLFFSLQSTCLLGSLVRRDDALDSMLKQKSGRTAVYSGRNKSKKLPEIAKLRDLCTQFIAAHVDGMIDLFSLSISALRTVVKGT